MSDGLYDLRTARDLSGKAQRDYAAFSEAPSDDLLFNLLCTLNHLRDWICPAGHTSYQGRDRSSWTKEEEFHNELHHNPDYRIVRDLCNNAKHFSDSGTAANTETRDGFILDFNRVGDSLGHHNYIVEGRDLRSHLNAVMGRYYAFFSEA